MWNRFAAGQNLSGRGIKSPIVKTQLSKIPKRTLVNLIKLYRLLISSWTAPSCRFIPSCSTYAMEAIEKHGLIFGLALSFRRILRCNPWGAYGFDPVPDKLTWSKSKGGGSC